MPPHQTRKLGMKICSKDWLERAVLLEFSDQEWKQNFRTTQQVLQFVEGFLWCFYVLLGHVSKTYKGFDLDAKWRRASDITRGRKGFMIQFFLCWVHEKAKTTPLQPMKISFSLRHSVLNDAFLFGLGCNSDFYLNISLHVNPAIVKFSLSISVSVKLFSPNTRRG